MLDSALQRRRTVKRLSDDTTPQRKGPIQHYLLISFLYVVTRGMTNLALTKVNFPTSVIFKSSKIVPVMVGSTILLGKRYSLIDYVCAICIVVGLVLFTLGDIAISPAYDWTGVALLLVSLWTGSGVGNGQEYMMKKFGASETEVGESPAPPTSECFRVCAYVWLSVVCDHVRVQAQRRAHTQSCIVPYLSLASTQVLGSMGLFGCMYNLVWLFLSGELFTALNYCNNFPASIAVTTAAAATAQNASAVAGGGVGEGDAYAGVLGIPLPYVYMVSSSVLAYCALVFVMILVQQFGPVHAPRSLRSARSPELHLYRVHVQYFWCFCMHCYRFCTRLRISLLFVQALQRRRW